MIFLVGLYPGPLMEMLDATVRHLVQQTKGIIPVGMLAVCSQYFVVD